MSVGHVARLMEESGIPTVVLASHIFRPRLEAMALPRVLYTPHLMGRPVGAPGDVDRQQEVLLAALHLLESAEAGGATAVYSGPFRS